MDLHGATAGLQAVQPLDALGRFVRALGMDAAMIPADVAEASAAFRSRVAGRRLLEVLAPEEAMELLGRLAGQQRVAVEPEAAAAFALLGVLDGPDVGVVVTGWLLDESEDAAERVLERLVDAQLLETSTPGRYRMHDLLRLYARELARQRHPEPERAAALTRAIWFYVTTAWQTLALLRPGDYRLARADERWRKGGWSSLTTNRHSSGWRPSGPTCWPPSDRPQPPQACPPSSRRSAGIYPAGSSALGRHGRAAADRPMLTRRQVRPCVYGEGSDVHSAGCMGDGNSYQPRSEQ